MQICKPIDTRTLSGGLTGLEMAHESLVRRLEGLARQLRKWSPVELELEGLGHGPRQNAVQSVTWHLCESVDSEHIRATAAEASGRWRCAKWQS